jgi:hypothetical protein
MIGGYYQSVVTRRSAEIFNKGWCSAFDGTNKVSVSAPPAAREVVILSGWYKLVGAATGKFVLSNSNGTIRILYYSNGQTRFYCGDTNGVNFINTTGNSYNVWYHFAIVMARSFIQSLSGNQLVYLNNVRVGGINSPVNSASDIWTVAPTYNLGGWRQADGYLYAGTCNMLDFRVQTCENKISTIEGLIKDSYQFFKTPSDVSLKLDEEAGATAFDSSGNGRHGAWENLKAGSHRFGTDVPTHTL